MPQIGRSRKGQNLAGMEINRCGASSVSSPYEIFFYSFFFGFVLLSLPQQAWMTTPGDVPPSAIPGVGTVPAMTPAAVVTSAMPGGLQQGFQKPPATVVTAPAGRGGVSNVGSTGRPQPVLASRNNPENLQENWTEHKAPDGRSYYFNKVTLASTYERPACIPAPVAPLPQLEQTLPPCKWKAYQHGEKTYYSDGKASIWEKPPELVRYEAALAERDAQRSSSLGNAPTSMLRVNGEGGDSNVSRGHSAGTVGGGRGKSSSSLIDISQIKTEEQKLKAFDEMFSAYHISSRAKYPEVEDQCSGDPRWALLRKGPRKQSLTEFQDRKRKEELLVNRKNARKAKDDFLKMLATNLDIGARTPWSEAQSLLSSDKRFIAVEGVRDQEEYFREFVDELAKKEREELDKRRNDATSALRAVLESPAAEGLDITHRTKWPDVQEAVLKLAATVPDVDALSEADKRRTLMDYVTDLQKKEEEKRVQERDERRKAEAEDREAFRKLLESKIKKGEIGMESIWRDVRELLEEMECLEYKAMQKQPLRVTRDVFEVLSDNMLREFRLDQNILRSYFEEKDFVVDEDTELKEVEALLVKEEEDVKIVELLGERHRNVVLAHRNLVERAERDRRYREKVERDRENRYLELLEDLYYRSDHVGITWDDAQDRLDRNSSHIPRDLSVETQKRLFKEHMSGLRKLMEEKAARMKALRKERDSKNAATKEDGEVSGSGGEEEKRGRSHSHSCSRSCSRSGSSSRGHKHRKKDKKKKKKHRKSKRHRSRSRTPSRSRSRSQSRSSRGRKSSHRRKHLPRESDGGSKERRDERDYSRMSRSRSRSRSRGRKSSHQRKHLSRESDGGSKERRDERDYSRMSRSRSRERKSHRRGRSSRESDGESKERHDERDYSPMNRSRSRSRSLSRDHKSSRLSDRKSRGGSERESKGRQGGDDQHRRSPASRSRGRKSRGGGSERESKGRPGDEKYHRPHVSRSRSKSHSSDRDRKSRSRQSNRSLRSSERESIGRSGDEAYSPTRVAGERGYSLSAAAAESTTSVSINKRKKDKRLRDDTDSNHESDYGGRTKRSRKERK